MFSVIIPAFNCIKSISMTVESVLKQSYDEFELLIIDDGSTDGTERLLDTIATEDERIKVFHKDNGGVSSARNYGISHATEDYIIFIDSDDVIDVLLLEKCAKCIEKCKSDLIIFNFNYCKEFELIKNKVEIIEGEYSAQEFYSDCFAEAVKAELINAPWNKCVSRKLLIGKKICFNTEYSIFEDALFSAQLLNAVSKIYFYPEQLYNYCLNSENSLRERFRINKYTALSAVYEELNRFVVVYGNGDEQRRTIDNWFYSAVSSFISQICKNDSFSFLKKRTLLKKILNDRLFLQVIVNNSTSIQMKGIKFWFYKLRLYSLIILGFCISKKVKK